jgi:hypothetical protein
MKKTNFFIIGAPRSGTTALSEYLSGHPHVFFSEPKEPHFFNEDFANRPTTNMRDYLRCFEGATEEHTAVGEGSVFYLRSEMAVSNILLFQPDARFIVMLRNPIDLVYSLHSRAVYGLNEDVTNFSEAWYLQDVRKQGRHLPILSVEPKVFLYGEMCLLGSQMERLYRTVSSERVKVIFLEDFVIDTRAAYEDTLAFLGLESDGRINFPPINTNTSYSSFRVEKALRHVYVLKRKLGISGGLGIGKWIRTTNADVRPREPMDPEIMPELKRFFEQDVIKLANVTGRNLDHWIA